METQIIGSVKENLGDVFEAAGLEIEQGLLEPFSRDESNGLMPSFPDLVVAPQSTSQVAKIASICHAHNVPLVARGGGTGKSGGCVPLFGGVVIDFSKLNKIKEIDVKNGIARVQPGVVLAKFKRAVHAKGLFYPPDPASLESCTIGGNIAENAGGPSCLKYGVTKDYVLGLKAVLADGEIVRLGKKTQKGVTGFDMTSLLCGSEGALALISEITLKLLPKPKETKTALLAFDDARNCMRAVAEILAAGNLPCCIEYLDKTSIEAILSLDSTFPLAGSKAALILETDSLKEGFALLELQNSVEIAKRFGLRQCFVATDERKRKQIWNYRNILSPALKRLYRHKVSEDIVVLRDKLACMVDFLDLLSKRHKVQICAFGHAGDGNLHVQLLFKDDRHSDEIKPILRELFVQTLKFGGTLTGEHGVGIKKREFLPLEQSERLISLQRKLKEAFDPKGILNPGKIFPIPRI